MKNVTKILSIIGASILALISIALIAGAATNKSTASLIIGIVFLIIAILLIIFICTNAKSIFKKEKKEQPVRSNVRTTESKKQQAAQASATEKTKRIQVPIEPAPEPVVAQSIVKKPIVMSHLTGLPIMEKMKCTISATRNEVIISSKGLAFTLPMHKIADVSITTNAEIQKSVSSSMGGAIGGAVLFGPLGAMIGGRAKERKTITIEKYLVFTYEDSGELKYIAFYVNNNKKAKKFVKDLLNNVTLRRREFGL